MKCGVKNPLVRDGLSRGRRALNALGPAYIKMDERGPDALLRYICRYAGKVRFYDIGNRPDGDWSAFFENDASTVAALARGKDAAAFRQYYREAVNILEKSSSSENSLKEALQTLFSVIFTMAFDMDCWYRNGAEGLKLETEVYRAIKGGLDLELKEAQEAYKKAKDAGLVEPVSMEGTGGLLKDIDPLEHPFDAWKTDLSPRSNWTAILSAQANTRGKINALSERLGPVFDAFLDPYMRIINRSGAYFLETMKHLQSHEPHMALLLSFLNLFRHAQKSLNRLTGRHLEFYYKKVLRLTEKEAVPDRVHLVFELAKHVNTHLLKKGTVLSAGKDSLGKEVFYRTEKDTVLNKARVEKVKTVYVDSSDNGRVYSASKADSMDGMGKPFDATEPKWKTFGKSQKKEVGYLDETDRTMAFAEIGFAIASPALLLGEGERNITLTVICEDEFPIDRLKANEDINEFFAFTLSGKKGWEKTAIYNVSIGPDLKKITFNLTLGQAFPPIVPFDPKKHEGKFPGGLPVLNVILRNVPGQPYGYDVLKDITVTGLEIDVTVEGFKELVIQNDTGPVKADKPFFPFTASPSKGSRFYIGSPEIFSKGLHKLDLKISWKDVPADNLETYHAKLLDLTSTGSDNSLFKAKSYLLFDKEWEEGLKNLFNTDASKEATISYAEAELQFFKAGPVEPPFAEYAPGVERGFLMLELSEPANAFGHSLFSYKYAKAVIDYAKGGAASDIPGMPYTPQIASIKAGYKAKEDLFASGLSRFFHVYPFGIKEAGKNTTLLPVFESGTGVGRGSDEGELYIGISSLVPPQNLSLLFQMAEGSADPELERKDVNWSYLKGDEWVPFEKTEVLSDSTEGLIKSGIITFAVPSGAGGDNTVMPGGLLWIRGSAREDTGAYCETIKIHAQAASAVFADNGNDPGFLASPVPAGTICKFREKDPAIKQAAQPYASLGGRVREGRSGFSTRVSERLRHKGRGVTIWDYERLVLERFPSVYKAKCINHSVYASEVSEFAPGFVTVIVIPDLRNKNSVNPLEPRAPLATLEEIREYLSGLVSPFAAERLRVLNPLYEKIRVEFEVEFLRGFDRGYYAEELDREIVRFLSPWAFEEGADIAFGGKIHSSSILKFVEKRPYVDYVKDFRMYRITKGPDGTESSEQTEEAFPATARSVFVSSAGHTVREVTGCR